MNFKTKEHKKRSLSSFLGVMLSALLILALLCGCSDKEPVLNEFQRQAQADPQIQETQAPDRFTADMVERSGFLLGVQTAQDIENLFGTPESVNESSFSTRYSYPFGAFEFDPALYYVEGRSGLTGPCGIKAGDDMRAVAELFCAGSSEKIGTADEVLLYDYGEGSTGLWSRLTAEFAGDVGVYQLEYRAPGESGTFKLTICFDKDEKLTAFMIQLT